MHTSDSVGWILIAADTHPDPLSLVPWPLLLLSIAWAAIWTQFVLVPFFFKKEKLHQEYHGNGKINEAVSKIESDRLFPALASLIQKVVDSRTNKKVPLTEILGAVDLSKDLDDVQKASADMQKVRYCYDQVKNRVWRVWSVTLAHVILSPISAACVIFLLPISRTGSVLCAVAIVLWLLTLIALIWQLCRFGSFLSSFLHHLESTTDGGT